MWKNKSVVLLGGASLIGSHLAEALIEKGVKRLRIVDDLSVGKITNVRDLPLEFIISDLREYKSACRAVKGMDIVFHLAAQHGGRGYVAGHKVELYDNLSLDTTIFRACAGAVEKVIFSSSACAYPIHLQTDPNEFLYLSEDMVDYSNLLQADGPYGTEKLIGEVMLDAYVDAGHFKGCSTRSYTVYGPRMGESHAIAALIAKVLIRQEPFEVWGDGNQIRNWTYVKDNVAGALLAAENLDRGAVNIGIEERLTPNIALNLICDIMGWSPEKIEYALDKPVGPKNRVANSQFLYSLGWSPSVSFREGLEKTVEWYLSTHKAEDVRRELGRKLTEI